MGMALTPDTTLYHSPPRAALLEPASFAAGLSKSVGKKKMFYLVAVLRFLLQLSSWRLSPITKRAGAAIAYASR